MLLKRLLISKLRDMKKFTDIKTSVLAKELSVTQSYVSNMKAGRTQIPADIALRVNKLFGTPLWEIRPDIYPRHLFEANDASESNQQQRPTELGANV
jgi:DNA-binding transcriptional regulator YdaS (Cro superfamily)